jgi:hypothetical protein
MTMLHELIHVDILSECTGVFTPLTYYQYLKLAIGLGTVLELHRTL